IGYLPIGAAATGGGSLRGKSAAAATLSMATSPAVTIITIFMMLIPSCCSPGTGDRVTPLFRLVCARRPLNHPTVRLNRRGMAPDYLSPRPVEWFKCDWEDGEGRRLTKWSPTSMVGSDSEVLVHCHHSFTVRPPACAYLTTADASSLLLVFPVSFAPLSRRPTKNRADGDLVSTVN